MSANNAVQNQLQAILARSGLPPQLQERLVVDATSPQGHYQRVADVKSIPACPASSSYWGTTCACCCVSGVLVPNGHLGRLQEHDNFVFLAPGYHTFSNCGEEFLGNVSTNQMNKAVIHGSSGFVIVSESHVGVLLVESEYKMLAPGVYFWNSPAVKFEGSVDVTTSVAKIGVCTLVTCPDGMAAVTYHNGQLRILGWDDQENSSSSSPAAAVSSKKSSGKQLQRTFFLDDPKWIFSTFISLKEQTDKLEGNDLLSRDNVEILMVAMSQWRIVDPELAIKNGAEDMEKIRFKVNQLVRACIARIVAGTNIGAGGGGTGASNHNQPPTGQPQQQHQEQHQEEDLAHLMQSEAASQHMKDLSKSLKPLGIVCSGIYVPERFFKNSDLRQEIARQAVIGIKAEAERSAADAKAYATISLARAEAESISTIAEAHASAGKLLGDPSNTAARLALSDVVGKSLQGANVTVFSGAPDQMPFMLTAPHGQK